MRAWMPWVFGYLKNAPCPGLRQWQRMSMNALIEYAIRRHQGNISKAADFLGVNRTTLQMKMRYITQVGFAAGPRLADSQGVQMMYEAVEKNLTAAEEILSPSELKALHDRVLELMGERVALWVKSEPELLKRDAALNI